MTYRPLPALTHNTEDAIWEAAGITQEERAGTLAHAFRRTQEAMDASVIKVFQSEGSVVYSKPLIDHVTRLKASKQAATFAGVHERNTTPPPVNLVINMPGWTFGLRDAPQSNTPDPIDIPAEAVLIRTDDRIGQLPIVTIPSGIY